MSISEHEKAYTPSEWSKRYESDKLLLYFHKKSQEITNEAQRITKCELNVPYSTSERTKYDIYGTDLPNDAPIFLFIHGGYWQEFSKDFAGFPVKVLVSRGIKVIVAGYNLCPTVTFSQLMQEVKIMMEEILKLAKDKGSSCVWVAGHSAGAQMAASLLHDTAWLAHIAEKKYAELLKGLVLIGGIYNLEPLLSTSYNNALNLTNKELETYSFGSTDTCGLNPVQNLKVIVTVGECDSPVFIQESRNYAQKLLEFVDNVEFLLLRNSVDHFDIVENLTNDNFALTKLIIKNVYL
ncbi:kynurenine formamidase [Orussus abietinus]|uniref:kynurenine formamidase n=1 Tax=Orussus abietinus TaxID=222816 RepID=UPI000625E5BA|nr:kynurenine formamidase [Orussus abietinus]